MAAPCERFRAPEVEARAMFAGELSAEESMTWCEVEGPAVFEAVTCEGCL